MKASKTHAATDSSKGFTLIELLVVIAIITVLAAISCPVTVTVLNKARKMDALSTMESLETGVNRFYSEYGYLPSNKRSNPPSWDDQVWTNRGEPMNFRTLFIGRMTSSLDLTRSKARGLVGRIAELAIFPRAFTPNKIETLESGQQ